MPDPTPVHIPMSIISERTARMLYTMISFRTSPLQSLTRRNGVRDHVSS